MGKTNNPNGRPKGMPNRITAETRQIIKTSVDDLAPYLSDKFGQLEARDWVLCFIRLLEFVTPKAVASTDIGAEDMSMLFEAAAREMERKM